MSQQVLLIVEYVPDDLKIYKLIVDVDTLNTLKKCHGKYGNTADDEHDDLINNWLANFLEGKEADVNCDSEDFPPLVLEGHTTVILTGYLM